MKSVLMVTAEFSPFVKSGGLGDVLGSLPKALREEGVDVRIMMPNYAIIPQQYKDKMQFVKEIVVVLGWRKQYCGILEMDYNGLKMYFIDNLFYFGGDKLYYDMENDIERFAFFSMSVMSALPHIDFAPDVVHCHDWHTSLVPIVYHAHFKKIRFYSKMKMVMTIHNLKYQGICNKYKLYDLIGISDEYSVSASLIYDFDLVNCFKGALSVVDKITTVSSTYAQEIRNPYFGEGMDWLLRWRGHDLVGIVNGIDYKAYNPGNDDMIFANYTSDDFTTKKKKNKEKLQEMLDLERDVKKPIIGFISRLVAQKGIDLIMNVFDEMIYTTDIQFVMIGTGDANYERFFADRAAAYPGRVSSSILFDETLAHKVYSGSDFFLMPSLFEPCGISQMIAMRYGTIPIVRETGGLSDTVMPYNEFTKTGNGYTFTNYNAHDMLYTIKLALENYRNKRVHNAIARAGMGIDYSWKASAQKYIELYEYLEE